MKKTLFGSAILAVIAAAIVIYFLAFEKPMESGEGPPESQPQNVFAKDLQPDRITVTFPEQTLEMAQDPDQTVWRITRPIASLVDPIYMDLLLKDISRLEKERLVDLDPKDLSAYQLDKPRVKITVHYPEDSTEVTLLIGKVNFTQDYLFAKIESEPTVFLIKPNIYQFVDVPLDTLRAKALFVLYGQKLVSFEIIVDAPELKNHYPKPLEPKLIIQNLPNRQAQWIIVEPIHETSDSEKVHDFFGKLANVATEKIYDVKEGEDLSRFGLDKPRARVVFSLADGRKNQILFGSEDESGEAVFAKNDQINLVLPISKSLFEDTVNANFRDEKITYQTGLQRISSIVLELPEQPEKNLVLKNDGFNVFVFQDDQETPVANKRLLWILRPFRDHKHDFLYQVEPLPRKEYGLDPPHLNIKFLKGDEPVLDVSLGNTVREGHYVDTIFMDNKKNCISSLPGNLYDMIPYSREYLRATEQEKKTIDKRRAGKKQ